MNIPPQPTTTKGPFLGAHVSISDGLPTAPVNGKAIGGDAIQIFSRNQRSWKAKALEPAVAEAFRAAMPANGIREAVIHDSYLINLSSATPAGLAKSRAGFIEEMDRAQMLGIRYVIFHPGAHMGAGEEEGIRLVAESLDHCISKANAPDVQPLIEVTAGQGTTLGWKLEQVRDMIDRVSFPDRVHVCIDTCHFYQAGYDIRTRAAYEESMRTIDSVLGIRQVRAFHLNDAKQPFGSHIDRHECIGRGTIGLEAFWCIVNDPRFDGLPMVLETPEEERYAEEVALLRRLRGLAAPPAPLPPPAMPKVNPARKPSPAPRKTAKPAKQKARRTAKQTKRPSSRKRGRRT